MAEIFKLAETKEEIAKALEVRYLAQLAPLGISKKDVKKNDLNSNPITIICLRNGEVLASSTAFPLNDTDAELVYLAVRPDNQHEGIGKKTVLAMEKELNKRGFKRNIILARTYLNEFYSGLGYRPCGEIEKYKGFAEKGMFHQKMSKEL